MGEEWKRSCGCPRLEANSQNLRLTPFLSCFHEKINLKASDWPLITGVSLGVTKPILFSYTTFENPHRILRKPLPLHNLPLGVVYYLFWEANPKFFLCVCVWEVEKEANWNFRRLVFWRILCHCASLLYSLSIDDRDTTSYSLLYRNQYGNKISGYSYWFKH